MDFERRFVTVDALRLERRAEGGGATLVGYAALFGSLSVNLGGFREQIEPGAFKESISEDDIRSLFNHDEDHVLGRLANKTLRLAEDAKGLRFENDLPDTQTARDLATLIERGDVSQMSFAFRVKPNGDRWDEDPDVLESDPNDDWHWAEELAKVHAWREQLIVEHDGVPVGFVQIIDPALEDSHYWGDCGPGLRAIDIWIGEPPHRGRGVGGAAMREAILRCFAAPEVTAIIIDPLASNTDAIRFYERLGFTFVERRMFGADDCHVMRLERGERT